MGLRLRWSLACVTVVKPCDPSNYAGQLLWGGGSIYSDPRLFLPVSHQSWETDPLVLIHEGIVLSREGCLGPEGPDHQTALEGLSNMGTYR